MKDIQDPVQRQMYESIRKLHIFLTGAAFVFAVILYVFTKSIVPPLMLLAAVILLSLLQFDMGRRMRNGTYGSRSHERADLARWIERMRSDS